MLGVPYTKTMKEMTDAQVAWMAGVIEGEGTFGYRDRRPRISVEMTDRDVLDRLHNWTGIGHIYSRKREENWKEIHAWVVTRRGDVAALASVIEPWLMARRGARLREVISLMQAEPVSAIHAAAWSRRLDALDSQA